MVTVHRGKYSEIIKCRSFVSRCSRLSCRSRRFDYLLLVFYEVRSGTKLVFRLVDPLFRVVSFNIHWVRRVDFPDRIGVNNASIRLVVTEFVVTEFVASTPQIDSSWVSFFWTRRYRVRLVDFRDRLIMHHFKCRVRLVDPWDRLVVSWFRPLDTGFK